jgi:hypothetical protein
VESPIGILAHQDFVFLVVFAHFLDELRELRKLRIINPHRCQGAGFTLDGAPRFEKLEEADVLVAGGAGGRQPVENLNARSQAHLDQFVEFQGNDGFANRRPRYVE